MDKFADLLWYPSLTFFLIGVGLVLSVRFRWIQLRCLAKSFHALLSTSDSDGDFSPFEAMSTALAGMIGTGNIAGVSAAVALGGAGAVFWMAVAAFFGMAIKFAETYLAVSTRRIDRMGRFYGGPMIYIETILGSRILGAAYAALAIVSSLVGSNLIQANAVASAVKASFRIPPIVTAVFLTTAVFFCVLGGARRIAKFCSYAVPISSFLYISSCIILSVLRFHELPNALQTIIDSAFGLRAFRGAGAGIAVRYGVSRGVFTNEAGVGTEAIYTAASKTKAPASQGLLAMLTPFIDTIIVCSLTGLALVLTHSTDAGDAFLLGLGGFGRVFITALLTVFGLATLTGASYSGDRCLTYLRRGRPPKYYGFLWCAVIWLGCTAPTQSLWCLSDICSALMAIPNLLALLFGLKKIEIFY